MWSWCVKAIKWIGVALRILKASKEAIEDSSAEKADEKKQDCEDK